MSKIVLKNSINNDEYTDYVYQHFDIQNTEESIVEVNFDLSKGKNIPWNIGLIYGSSGSGKTTILNKLGKIKKVEFDNTKPLISNFDFCSPKEASFLLSSMGLSSVPTWLRPYKVLSNGEKYRAEVAYLVGNSKEGEVILIDEFTSVVDRDVAKAMSNSIQKYVRRKNKKIVLASCHHDIMEWLLPDWICSPEKNEGVLEEYSHCRQRPSIELQVSRTEASTWNIFKKHHYLTENLNKSAKCLLFTWNNKPVGFCAILNTPRKGTPHAVAISRVVVLPDYQGLGIGKAICNFVGAIFTNEGNLTYIKTVNPALGENFKKSNEWAPTSKNGKFRKDIKFKEEKYKNRVQRVSYCYKYIGGGLKGYEELLLPIKDMRKRKSKMEGELVII